MIRNFLSRRSAPVWPNLRRKRSKRSRAPSARRPLLPEPLEQRVLLTLAHPFELSSLPASGGGDGSAGFVLNGVAPNDLSGVEVNGAGDINNDGFDDVVIGSANVDTYVVFGQAGLFQCQIPMQPLQPGCLVLPTDLDGTNGFVITGSHGHAVSGAGDVNGDGIDDLVTTDTSTTVPEFLAGTSYVVFGHTGPFAATLDVAALDGTNGFAINGIDAADQSGGSVSGAGDVNGDGFDDLVIGADLADPNGNNQAGESYVVFGHAGPFAASLNLSALDGMNGFVINGIDPDDFSAESVSGAGDVNGDGFDDLVIGARGGDPNGNNQAGESYVVFGHAGPFAATLNLSALNGTNGFVINGIDADDFSADSVSGAGNVNGDGFDDLVIGARGGDPNGIDGAGESYVVFGHSGPFAASLELSALDGTNGLLINGIDESDFSGNVGGAGDVNGDGVDDLLISATSGDPNGNDGAGETYVIFGVGSAVAGPPTVTEMLVKGSGWPQAFLDHLAATGMGTGGYSIPTGSSVQFDALPWSVVNQVLIRFSENVDVQQGDLEIRGVNVASYAFSGFSYNPATFEATWTLASVLAADKLLLDLDGTSVTGVTGVDDGLLLDGEFANGVDVLPASGDGTSGGDFEFRINVLPGDVNSNGAVTTADVGLARSRVGNAIGDAGYDKLVDANANGAITTADVGFVRSRVGTVLPGPKPTSASRSRAADAAFEALAVRERAGLPVLKRQSSEPVLVPQMQTGARLLSSASSANQSPPRREADAMVSLEENKTTWVDEPEWMDALAGSLSVPLQAHWEGVS